MIAKFLLAPALAAALVAAPAFAGKALAAADQTLGMALSGAYVFASGNFNPNHSSGVVSVTKVNTGEYDVKFNRNLDGCTPAAMPALQGRIVILVGIANGDTWIVRTIDRASGTVADSNFTILNFCAR